MPHPGSSRFALTKPSAFLADEAIQFLRGHSFEPVSFEPGFADPVTGHQLQANIIFKRTGIP